MIFFYGLCYYYGKNKLSNIVNHHKCIQELRNVYKDSTFSMILNVMIDIHDADIRDNISENLKKTIFDLTGETIIVLNNFNYGGTIAGLYDTFNFLKSYCEFDCYIIILKKTFIQLI
jgi:hypothetical protein